MDEYDTSYEKVPSTEQQVVQVYSKAELLKRIHNFEEPNREVLYLRLFGDLSFREIGEILGRSENWARVTYYRSKEKLRKELEQDEE